jgi:hypothetical protein
MRRRLGPLTALALLVPLCVGGCSVDLLGSDGDETSAPPPPSSATTSLTRHELRSALLRPGSLGTFQVVKDVDGRDLGLGCLDGFLIDDAQPSRAEVTLAARSMFQLPLVFDGIASLPTTAEAKAALASYRSQVSRCTKLPFGPGNPLRVSFAGDTVRTDLNGDVDDEINVVASTTMHFDVDRGFYRGKDVDIPVTFRFVAARVGNQVLVTGIAALGGERPVELMSTMIANTAISRLRAVLQHESPPTVAPLGLHVTVVDDVTQYVH